jgi:hypothetical protein
MDEKSAQLDIAHLLTVTHASEIMIHISPEHMPKQCFQQKAIIYQFEGDNR